MKYMPGRYLFIVASIAMAGICAPHAWAQGKLDAFEADVTARADHRQDTHRDGGDSCLSDFFGEVMSDVFKATLLDGGECSWDRVALANLHDGELNRVLWASRLGYRWVQSPHESLDGPYAGLSIRL